MKEERSRLILWALVVCSLIAALLMTWQPVNRELENTSLVLANKRIIERANTYKQEWLLRGRPASLEFDGKVLTFSASGWVFPREGEKVDCSMLLNWLYPDEKILNSLPDIHGENVGAGYICYFDFYDHQTIKIILKNNRFSSVVISSA
ncbi:MSHA biogenesis protein MshF [Vibrio fluvialis]|nr:MSHA biogenesis protein MshF [Vibrio fluvialis]